ncbi:MAG: hypothetical protein KA765_08695 [Thermoflexales bacterium]|nr:hypothetical protein [Thermoflexales bacterium]
MTLLNSRRTLLIASAIILITSLACSLGTGAPAQPVNTPVSPAPVQTMPPVARVSPSPTTSPTPVASPTETPLSGTGPGGCVLKEEFVADVTIPDNTVLAPGTAFVKTWRVKNTGTCTWDAAYQLVFTDGNQLSGPGAINISATAAGANLDLSINLTAPTTPGSYTGRWRLKSSNNIIFGGMTVVIVVPAPPTPTAIVTLTPTLSVGPWNGKWETNCGAAACGTMQLVQTGSTVTGTFGISGTIKGTVIGTRLMGTWARGGDAGSIDWWLGGTGVKWRGNYNTTNAWCGHRTGETDPAPCGVGTFAGEWNVVCAGCDGAMSIVQDGRTFNGTYVNGTVEGTIDGTTASGTWRKTSDGTTGPLTWFLLNGQQFNGNYGGTNQWCGYRSGSGAPAPCLKP